MPLHNGRPAGGDQKVLDPPPRGDKPLRSFIFVLQIQGA